MQLFPTRTAPEKVPEMARPGTRKFQTHVIAGVTADSYRILNLPSWLYHADLERQSCSLLKPLLQSPAHYRAQFFQGRSSSPAMELGSLVHVLVLEPHRLHVDYLVVPGNGRPSPAETRALAASHPGKKLITDVEMQAARRLAQRILERQFKGRSFGRYLEEGEPEATVHYTDPVTAVPCRVRIDLWHPDFLFDLKTTRHVDVLSFSRTAVELHYDLQSYMYCLADALHEGRSAQRPFVFVAACSADPYPAQALTAGESFLVNGRAKYERAISLYRGCSDLDYWPDGSEDGEIEIEPWQAYRPEAHEARCARVASIEGSA